MFLKRLVVLGSMLFASLAFGQVDSTPVEAEPANLVTLTTEVEGRWMPSWVFSPDAEQFEIRVWPDGKSVVVSSGLPGSTRIVLLVPSDVAKPVERHVIKSKGKLPPKPDPIDPVDPVDPPGPKPEPPTPAPIPEPGFRVLVAYEAMQSYPAALQNVIDGAHFRSFLNQSCAKDVDGRPAYRIYDRNADVAEDYPTWQAALKRVPETNQEWPYLIVSNGKTGWEGSLYQRKDGQLQKDSAGNPIPLNEEQIMQILQKVLEED